MCFKNTFIIIIIPSSFLDYKDSPSSEEPLILIITATAVLVSAGQIFFFTSFFFSFFFSISSTPDEDHVSKALVFLIVPYVLLYR